MKLLNLKIKNIRCIEEANIVFQDLNFISGWNKDTKDCNGCAKSTIIDCIKILFYGPKLISLNIKDYVRKGQKSGKIYGEILLNNDIYKITRQIANTASIKFTMNDNDLECTTSSDYQKMLEEKIVGADLFKKFRIIDDASGINLLDFTSGQLRKTLMALHEKEYDEIKKKLLDKKNTYDKFNKSAVLHKHYPSDKRLKVLQGAIELLGNKEMQELKKDLEGYRTSLNKLLSEKGKITQDKEIKHRQYIKFQNLQSCPTCMQEVTKEYKTPIQKNLQSKIAQCTDKLISIMNDITSYNDLITDYTKNINKLQLDLMAKQTNLNSLKYKLQTRIQQKDYKYTEEDIELAKEALSQIGQFASWYVLEWINIIEPIVNNYLDVLHMSLKFDTDEKGNIKIYITRQEQTFEYKQLSKGERTFISVLFKIALMLEQGHEGIMLADESFDCLAAENIERLIEICFNLPVQLIGVSHNQNFNRMGANQIYMIKENNISQVN